MSRAARAAMLALGAGAVAYGLWQLVVVAPSATRPLEASLWLAGVLVAHDAVLAPVAVLVGLAVSRALPRRAGRLFAGVALLAVTLILVAAPVHLRP
jgi:putative Ca2+/H+ antiporter (TMEM165/GDT1 family)